jgi:hypothetical protein
VRHDASALGPELVQAVRGRAARTYAVALLTVAVTLVVVLLTAGATFPKTGALLLLAIPLALCVNRFVFFPNETGVTADAAVLFAAMVAFRADAPWVGALVLALFTGPLDARHWHERSFARMAYNSGATTLVAAAGLAVFVPLGHALGSDWASTLAAAAVASVPYVVAESLLGVALVSLLGEPPAAAARQQAVLNSIGVPLALGGAAAGLAAVDVGWWCTFALLLPAPWIPELMLVVLPRRVRVSSTVFVTIGAGVALALAACTTGRWSTLGALVVIGVLVGLDGRWMRVVPLPLLCALAMVPAVVVPAEADRATGVVLVVAAALAAGWSARRLRRVSPASLLWCAPLLLAAWSAARVWREVGATGGLVFTLMMLVALLAAGAWGAPPWGSRHLGRWSARHLEPYRRAVLSALVTVVLGCVLAAAAPGVDALPTRLAEWGVQVLFAVALVAVCQWRFRPRLRSFEATMLAVGSAVAMLAPWGLFVAPFAVWVAWRTPRVGR